MINAPLFMRRLWQKDNCHFVIEWNDKQEQIFRLSEIQRQCPCANCRDEMTGQLLMNPETVQEDVRAVVIRQVGRYGLRIQFTSGCSTGIYSFDHLRQLTKVEAQ
jgi:DUF971 family protein